jgi:hypothetical protein
MSAEGWLCALARTDAFAGALRRMRDRAFLIGAALVRTKEAPPHGAFSNWLAAEFGWAD